MGARSKFTAPLIAPSTAGGILQKMGSGFTSTRQNPRHNIVHAGTGNIPVCSPRQIAAARSVELRPRIGCHRFSVHQATRRLEREADIWTWFRGREKPSSEPGSEAEKVKPRSTLQVLYQDRLSQGDAQVVVCAHFHEGPRRSLATTSENH